MLAHRVRLVGCDLAHEARSRGKPVGCAPQQRLDRLGSRRSRDQGAARLVRRDLLGQPGDLVLGDVGRVRNDEPQRPAQLRRERVEPFARIGDPHAGGRAAGDVGARDRERVGAHVGRPYLDLRQLRRDRECDRARAGADVGDCHTRCRLDERDPAPRPLQPRTRRLLQRDLDDVLRLRSRNEHAPIDEEVEAPEPPLAQHVLQRLARDPPSQHLAYLALGARRRGDVGDREPLTGAVSRHVFEDEPNLGLRRTDARAGQVLQPDGAQLAPRHRGGVTRHRAAGRVRRPRAPRPRRRAPRRARGRASAT